MWSNIESGILEMVLLLLNLADVACVASVCTQWRHIVKSFATDNRLTVRHRSWLVISDRPYEQSIALMNPLHHPIFPLSRRFCGAFGDWLVIVDKIDGIYLYHPLLRCVQLPPLTTPPLNMANNGFDRPRPPPGLDFDYVSKVILSSPPTSAECLVVMILGYKVLAFCRLGDSSWTKYEPEDIKDSPRFYYDAVFYNGRLVAIDFNDFVWSFGFKSGQIERQLLFQRAANWVVEPFNPRFLVESMGQLLMVSQRRENVLVRYGRREGLVWNRTYDFKIFQLGVNGCEWTPLDTLGKRVMFVTLALSTVVASDEIEEDLGSDCIYYTEFTDVHPADWVFFMADKRMVQYGTNDGGGATCWGNRTPLFYYMFNDAFNW